jgi:AcrR family transcriptional regulator
MVPALPTMLRVRQAAFALAMRRPWHDIGLADIAAESGLPLAELNAHVSSKAAILAGFSRDVDEAMLLVLSRDPPEGEPHDRLFDVVLKRLEIMAPYRGELAAISRSRPATASEGLALVQAVSVSLDWMLAAARLEDDPAWRGIGRAGLLYAYARTLRAWVKDDDPGLSRTMATLDRELRDASGRAARLAGLGRIGSGVAGFARTFIRQAFDRRKDDA